MILLLWFAAAEALFHFGPLFIPPHLFAIAVIILTLPAPMIAQLAFDEIGADRWFIHTLAYVIALSLAPWSIARWAYQCDAVTQSLTDPWLTAIALCLLVITPTGLYWPVFHRLFGRPPGANR